MFKKLFTLFVLASVGGLVAFGAMSSTKVPGTIRNQGAIVRDLVWLKNQTPIPVCWEDALPADPAAQAKIAGYRQQVQDAVHQTWEAASAVQFTGWNGCGNTPAVRIHIDDIASNGPHTTTLGRRLLGYPSGVSLDFAFQNWSPVCSANEADRVACIRSVAVHEFGHVLGFAHEQNRKDSPCKGQDQGPDPDQYVTDYDADSVMNYCNRKWNNGGQLSALDKKSVAILYGPHP